jgi:predicted ABC-class ATPase
VTPSWIEARFVVGLPAFGRRIAGRHAESIFFEEIPRIVRAALQYKSLDAEDLYTHVKTAEDADSLRENLAEFRGLELAAAINRLRTLSVRQKKADD